MPRNKRIDILLWSYAEAVQNPENGSGAKKVVLEAGDLDYDTTKVNRLLQSRKGALYIWCSLIL